MNIHLTETDLPFTRRRGPRRGLNFLASLALLLCFCGNSLSVFAENVTAPEEKKTGTTHQEPKEQGKHFGEEGFVGEPLSTDLVAVTLMDFLRFISDTYGVSFVYEPGVTDRKVNLKIVQQPWNLAVESVLRVNGLTYRRNNNLFEIATVSDEIKRLEELRKRQAIETLTLKAVSRQFKLKYVKLNSVSGLGSSRTQSSTPVVTPVVSAITGEAAQTNLPTLAPTAEVTGEGLISIIQQQLSAIGRVGPDVRTNTLIITDAPEYLDRIDAIIKLLDIPLPQIEITARIVSVDQNYSRDIGTLLSAGGVNTGNGAGGFFGTAPSPNGATTGGGGTAGRISGLLLNPIPNSSLSGVANTVFGFTTGRIGTAFISGSLQLQEQRGIVKTISTPLLTVISGDTGKINSGVQIPFISGGAAGQGVGVVQTIVFQEAKLGLEVTPFANGEGNITLKVNITNDSADLSSSIANGQVPISKQLVDTSVVIPDGGTTILGGIVIARESQRETRTPVLADIPFIGNAFKRRERTRGNNHLLIFVTTRIRSSEEIMKGEQFEPNINQVIEDEKARGREKLPVIPAPKPLAEPFRTPGQPEKGKGENPKEKAAEKKGN